MFRESKVAQERGGVNAMTLPEVTLFDHEHAHSVPKDTGRNGLYKSVILSAIGFVEAARI
jgi:hypothetical protein